MALIGLKQLDSVLTGSLQVSGSSGVTGSFSVDTGDIELVEDQRIYFEADKGTWIESDHTDRLRLVAGGQNMIVMDQDDGRVNIGYGQKLGVGLGNNTTPGERLEVAGNISSSGHITGSDIHAGGNLSFAGGTITGPTNDHFDVRSGKNVRVYLDDDNNSSFCKFTVMNGDEDVVFSIAESGKATIGEGVTATHTDGLTVVGNVSASGEFIAETGSFGRIETDVLETKTLIVSSSVTNVTIATSSGSTEFGDSVDDTHTFIGDITASGFISASGNIRSSRFEIKGADNYIDRSWDGSLFLVSAADVAVQPGTGALVVSGDVAATHVTASGTITAEHFYSTDDIVVEDKITTKNADIEVSLLVNKDQSGAGDFRVKSLNLTHQIFSDANKDRVGIGFTSPNPNDLSSSLHVSGDVTVTHVTASGDILAEGRIYEQGTSVIDHATAMAIVFGG